MRSISQLKCERQSLRVAGVNVLLKSNHPTVPPAVMTTILSMKQKFGWPGGFKSSFRILGLQVRKEKLVQLAHHSKDLINPQIQSL